MEISKMAVNNNYCKLAQYCAASFKKRKDKTLDYVTFSNISSRIFDSLDDINYKLPLDIPFQDIWMKDFIAGGSTLLHLALRNIHYDDVESLIKRGADLTLKNENGQTVLHRALRGIDYLQRDELITDPFISIILSAHINHNILENPSDEHGLSHFHIACMSNHVEAVKFFLKGGVSIHEAIGINSKMLPGYTPLHIAASYSYLKTVQVLLEHGADVSRKDVKSMTALHLLIERNMKLTNCLDVDKPEIDKRTKLDIEQNEKIINILVAEHGTNDRMDLSPLQIACTMQDPSKAKQLLETSDLHYSVSMDSIMWPGYTALHFAAHFNIDTVKLLLQKGADILAKDANNVTPFDLCVETYNIEDIHHLITNQQDLSIIKFSDKKTKLSSLILAMGNEKTFKSFIEKMSDINIHIQLDSPLWPGCTILHLAIIFIKNTYHCSSNVEGETDEGKSTIGARSSKRMKTENKLNLENISICLKKGMDVTAQDVHGQTPLHLAFFLQNKTVIDLLLEAHKKVVNPVNANGLSHLHIAVASGNRALTKKLLKAHKNDIDKPVKSNFQLHIEEHNEDDEEHAKRKLDINAGSTALHIAIAKRDYSMKQLLIKSGADVYARDECDLTPIHMIICFSENERFDFGDILDEVDNLEDCMVKSTGLNYLHVAACLDNEDIAHKLLIKGVDIELPITAHDSLPFLKKYDKMKPLEFAFAFSSFSVAFLLLEHGAEIFMGKPVDPLVQSYTGEWADFLMQLIKNDTLRQRFESEIGVTLLHFACASLDVEVAREAINKGADVNAQTFENSPFWPGCTPLHIAVSRFSPFLDCKAFESLVKLLLDHGAEVTLVDKIQQKTPIHQFYSKIQSKEIDKPQIVDWLLEAQKNFNLNPADGLGLSHFHIACVRDCVEVVKKFLDHGVDFNCQIDYFDLKYDGGSSPLHLTLNYGAEKSRDLLLERGADLSLADRLGNTPLHCAIKQYPSHFELFQRMIRAGADVMATNVFGITPFEMLLDVENTPIEMIELILKGGVCTNSFNPVTEEGYLAIAFFAISKDEKGTEMKPLFELMMAQQDLNVVGDMGRNAIYNLVSRKRQRVSGSFNGDQGNSVENYTSAIDRLIRIGCNVDHQDVQGRTPLHIATQLENYEAVVALFNCGADVNIIDKNEKPALAYTLEYGELKNVAYKDMFMPYYLYMSSLCSYGFVLSEANVKIYLNIRSIFQMNPVMMRLDYEEIEKLKEWPIGSSSMKLYDFLKEEGVAAYTVMKYDDRLAIDELFQSDRLRKELPNTTSYLLLRYNQARNDLQTRLALIEPAKVSLNCLVCCDVPEVCAHIIFGFLTISDLQNMIASVFDCE